MLQELQKNKEKTDFYITSVLHVKSWLRSIESMSVELQRKMQENLLGDLFRHAWQYSDWWRKRILQAGYIHDLENLSAFSVLDNIAPLLRTDVQEHFESLRAWRSYWSASDMVTSITSGSTGIPVRVEKLRDAYNLVYEAVGLVDHEWHQRDTTLPLLSLAADEDSSSPHWGSLFLALQGSGSVMNRYPSSRSSYEHAKWLMEHRPSYLKASPLRATEIGEVLLSQGNVLPLRQIISQSERVTPQQREICRRAFGGAKIVDRYSCEEVGWLAIQCPEHDHLHVMTGTTIIEIVDDHGNPCPVGVAGRVLVTNLHSFAMPIIRYDIGDIAEWGEECDCGIKLPVIRRLLGRKRNMVRLHDGTLIPMTFLGDYFEDLSVIKEYRLVQQKNGDIDFLVRAELPLTDNEVFKLRSLVLKVNAQLVVHIREVSSIDWGKGMKREEFVRLDE